MGFKLCRCLRNVTLALFAGCVLAKPRSELNLDNFPAEDIIERDVCILGGGSAGTYSAIRTRDHGKSVVVVERKDKLGGHTETFHDPRTGLTTEAGVIVFHNISLVTDYFGRFNIPLVKVPLLNKITYVNFETSEVSTYQSPNPAQALAKWAGILSQYPYLEVGINPPTPVPEDLLAPFGETVKKYGLADMVDTVWSISQGIGNLLSKPTLYVAKVMGVNMIQNLGGSLSTPNHDNSALYEKARAELGDDALLNADIQSVVRTDDDGVKVAVDTQSGRKLIKAKKLLVAFPPKTENLEPFDLDETESSIFQKFQNSYYYSFLLKNANMTAFGMNYDKNMPLHLPKLPTMYSIYPSDIPNYINAKFGSEEPMSDEDVKDMVFEAIRHLEKAGLVEADNPEIAFYSNHAPFNLRVSASDIADGFYNKLNALQGHRDTFYTGAAFEAEDSSLIWQFTEKVVLPKMLA